MSKSLLKYLITSVPVLEASSIFVEESFGTYGQRKSEGNILGRCYKPQRLRSNQKIVKLFNGRVQDSRAGAAGGLKHLFVAVGSEHFNSILGQMLHPVESKRIQSSIQRLVSREQSTSKRDTKKQRLSLKEKIKQRKKMMMKQGQSKVASEAFSCVVLSKPKQ